MAEAQGKRTTAQIGRCGELLVQYRLLKYGVESAAMTTDAGIDLVAYSPQAERPLTIQVKANLKPKHAGGRGRLALDWWLDEKNTADLVALVDLSTDAVWLFYRSEVEILAKQKSKGRFHFYFYCENEYSPRTEGTHATSFENYLIERRIEGIFYQSERISSTGTLEPSR